MKAYWIALCGLGLAAGFALAQQGEVVPPKAVPGAKTKAPPPVDKATRDKASYGFGFNIGRNIASDQIEVNVEALVQGMRDGLSRSQAKYTDAELEAAVSAFQEEHYTRMAAKRKAEGEANKKQGDAFLAKNAKMPGVKTTPSGLQYKILKSGKGPTPQAASTVKTHYRGTLMNGTEFDSSYKQGEPAEFPVNGVIKGWTEALKMMKVGDKWQLFIPPGLAYGEEGYGTAIPPNAMLIFEIELLAIVK